jgi:unsaturated rhamnogalacturonyl hydrolase
MKMKLKLLVSGCLLLGCLGVAGAQENYFNNWPAGVAPQEVGKALAEHFVTSPHQYTKTIHYSEVCAWYGALQFAELTHDDALRQELIKRFDPLMPGEAEADRIPKRHHVDDQIFGVVPMEIAIQTKDPKYLAFGKSFADEQWNNPLPDGLSDETRYWIDDMYMLTMLQLEAYRATGDKKYLDRDAKEMVAYLDKLQQPNGLFYHAPDVKYFWGRGDGWVAAGMAEMLTSLPENHPDRARILKGYRLMMNGLLKYQGKDGMWHELIDKDDAWPETSSSAMFSFAMITGVKHGWLDAATYGPAARKSWIAVVGYVDQNHDVTQVCEGTGKKDDMEYYYQRKRRTGDFHGQAPVMWAADALLRDR